MSDPHAIEARIRFSIHYEREIFDSPVGVGEIHFPHSRIPLSLRCAPGESRECVVISKERYEELENTVSDQHWIREVAQAIHNHMTGEEVLNDTELQYRMVGLEIMGWPERFRNVLPRAAAGSEARDGRE